MLARIAACEIICRVGVSQYFRRTNWIDSQKKQVIFISIPMIGKVVGVATPLAGGTSVWHDCAYGLQTRMGALSSKGKRSVHGHQEDFASQSGKIESFSQNVR